MARTIEIHDVPEGVYRALEARASVAGMAVSEYLLAQLEQEAKPTFEELSSRIASDEESLEVSETSAEILRCCRNSGEC